MNSTAAFYKQSKMSGRTMLLLLLLLLLLGSRTRSRSCGTVRSSSSSHRISRMDLSRAVSVSIVMVRSSVSAIVAAAMNSRVLERLITLTLARRNATYTAIGGAARASPATTCMPISAPFIRSGSNRSKGCLIRSSEEE